MAVELGDDGRPRKRRVDSAPRHDLERQPLALAERPRIEGRTVPAARAARDRERLPRRQVDPRRRAHRDDLDRLVELAAEGAEIVGDEGLGDLRHGRRDAVAVERRLDRQPVVLPLVAEVEPRRMHGALREVRAAAADIGEERGEDIVGRGEARRR